MQQIHKLFENHRKIASEASFAYILSRQKLSILAVFWISEACGQTVLPDRSLLIGQKLVKNAKIQMRHFESFSNNVNFMMMRTLLNFDHTFKVRAKRIICTLPPHLNLISNTSELCISLFLAANVSWNINLS